MSREHGLRRGFSSLAHRNYRLYWSGQLISLVGTWMQTVAQAWLVLELTHNPLALGITSVFQFTPVLVLGLFGGIIADALPKRATLYVTQGSAAILALILGLLDISGTVQVWQVWLLAGALGVVNSVDMPVRQAFVVEMVGREDVANAVALNSAVFNSARILGPAVAGILIALVGIALCFFLNAASYLAVIAGLLLMRGGDLRPAMRMAIPRSVGGALGNLAEGLRYIRHTPTVLIAISVLGVVSTVALNFSVVIPVYAAQTLHGDAGTYGFLMAASGVGSLAAAMFIAFQQRPTLRLLVGGSAVVGLSLVALSFSNVLAVSLLIMGALGASTIAMAATTNTLIQLRVPDTLRGRVMAVYTTVFAGSTPIGGLLSGALAGATSIGFTLVAAGTVTLLTAGAAFTRIAERAAPDAPARAAGTSGG